MRLCVMVKSRLKLLRKIVQGKDAKSNAIKLELCHMQLSF